MVAAADWSISSHFTTTGSAVYDKPRPLQRFVNMF